MTEQDITKLADWLKHIQADYKWADDHPPVKEHIEFLKRAEDWVRQQLP